jgi:hypothetical protein
VSKFWPKIGGQEGVAVAVAVAVAVGLGEPVGVGVGVPCGTEFTAAKASTLP